MFAFKLAQADRANTIPQVPFTAIIAPPFG
jgi:hypothetical protein